jgi:hypothetical protein
MFFKNHSEYNNQDTDEEHENGNPVDRIHIPYPAVRRLIWILLTDVKIFGQFAEYTHVENQR